MVLEQARAKVRKACEERQEASLMLAAYGQLVDAQLAIERLQQRMVEELRQDPNKVAAA